MGSSKKQTVSYWYHPFFQLALHEGPFDKLLKIRGGDVDAWVGELTASGSITVDAPNLWGGEEKEGGIQGTFDVMFGEMDAEPNVFFQTAMGPDPSNHNGVALLQFNSGRYGAGNPYPKAISVLTERIYEGWLEDVCWYPEKAAVLGTESSSDIGALLVAGQAVVAGGPVVAVASATAAPVFTGVPQATGADLGPSLPARHGDRTVLLSGAGGRYTTDPVGDWNSATTWPGGMPNGVVGGPNGWLAYNQNLSLTGNGLWHADAENPSTWTVFYPGAGVWHISFGGGYWWISAPGALRRAPEPSGPWDVHSTGGGIYSWLDIVEHDGALWASVLLTGDAGSFWQIRRSLDGGATWGEVVLSTSSSDAHRPYFLCPTGAYMVAWCLGGGVWTDANGWASWIDTGIGGAGTTGAQLWQVDGGRQIASANGLAYVINTANQLATFNPATLTVSDPITLPINSARGIVASPGTAPPATTPQYMNPAHIIYDSLTYLQGEPIASIDAPSFTVAADRLYLEGFGICTKYNHAQETIEQFRQRILDLIGAECSRHSGKWYLDLIRELSPAEVDALPILTDDDILDWQEDPTNRDDAVNQVAVKWFDPETKQSRITPHVHALAAINTLGSVNPEVRDYPEIPYEALANRVCLRDLRNKSTPTRRFNQTTNRKPYNWRKGQAFRLQSPRRGIADMVCRVADIDRGTLQSGAIRLVALQDIFAMPATAYVTGQPSVPPPSPVPEPIAHQALFEAPYVELAGVLSPGDLAALEVDAAFALAAGVKPGNGQGFALLTRSAGGEFERAGTFDWCPSAVVVEGAGFTDTAFTLDGGSLLARVELGTAALWGDELVRVDALDLASGATQFGRGCGDTVAGRHDPGERIYFFDAWAATDQIEYATAETVEAKLLPRTGTQELPEPEAPVLELTMDQRAARPYPPAALTVNGEADPTYLYGTLTVAWSDRDRIAQADQLVDQTVGPIGPEPGTTVTVRCFVDDVLDSTQDGVSGGTADVEPSTDGLVRLEVETERDGLVSWQMQVREFAYTVEPPRRRAVVGGDQRITTSGEQRTTKG